MTALASVSRPAQDDLQLVARVRAGDERAFDALYRRYQRRITAYVRGRVRDHGRAEDITQEVFMSALRRMRETDGAIAFKPWIYEIAGNACIDAWRRRSKADEVSFDAHDGLRADDHGRLAHPGATPDSAIDRKLAFDNLRGALGGLSQTHHEILVMREFEGLSYSEIGERLGMSRPGVESTLFRARRRLSEEYEELVSGERCRRVQAIIDARGARAGGVRDERRMARHIAHCQPCRRHAHRAGVDLEAVARPAAAPARIAAWLPLPLPLWLRRRSAADAGQALAPAHSTQAAQLSASVAATLDPATACGVSKALATAATVAVAALGAGAAVQERRAIEGLLAPKPATQRKAPARSASAIARDLRALLRPPAGRPAKAPAAPPAAGDATAAAAGGPTSPAAHPGRDPSADARGRQSPAPLDGARRGAGATAPAGPSAAPQATTAGGAAGTAQTAPVTSRLDATGGDAVAGAGDRAPATSAPGGEQGPVASSIAGAVGAVKPSRPATVPPAQAAPAAPAASDRQPPELADVAGTVASTVTGALTSAAAGRIGP